MIRRAWTVVGVVVAAIALARPAVADDREGAAEHFALAQSAERRADWRTAIDEYEQAYALQAHPAVLFNIGNSYEQLGDFRAAARYFLRYLDDNPDADDRDVVLQRVTSLRKRPSRVSFVSTQAGAQIYVDDLQRGAAPIEVELAAGSHRAWAERDGARSPVRTIAVEYGDKVTITLDAQARPGTLQIDSNVVGAEVRLDGDVIGFTPYAGEVDAGNHVVVVGMTGYASVERKVAVPERGSEQLRINLTRIGGDPAEPSADRTAKLLLQTAYGYNASASGGIRLQFALGYRLPSNRLEVSVIGGAFGADIGGGVGGESRLFFATGPIRPYLRAGALFGLRAIGDTGGRGLGFEAGLGAVYAVKQVGNVGYEYFLEVDGQYLMRRDKAEEAMDEDDSAFQFPFLIGVAIRIGAGN